MALVTGWSVFFQSSVRMRGRALFQAQAVQLEPGDDTVLLCARIQPPATRAGKAQPSHEVTLAADNGHVSATCTCDSFTEGRYCEHLWAALLTIQHSEDHKSVVQQLTPLRVRPAKAGRRPTTRSRTTRQPDWMARLLMLQPAVRSENLDDTPLSLLHRVDALHYVIQAQPTLRRQRLCVELRSVDQGLESLRGRALALRRELLEQLQDEQDRRLCAWLMGLESRPGLDRQLLHDDPGDRIVEVAASLSRFVLDELISTGRCYVAREDGLLQLQKSDQPATWQPWLTGQWQENALALSIQLRSGDGRTMAVEAPSVIIGGPDGWLIQGGSFADFDDQGALRWVMQFRENLDEHKRAKPLLVERDTLGGFLERLYRMPNLPLLALPSDLGTQHLHVNPQPCLDIRENADPATWAATGRAGVTADFFIAYNDQRVAAQTPGRFVVLDAHQEEQDHDEAAHGLPHAQVSRLPRVLERDRQAEQEQLSTLIELGFRSAGPLETRLSISAGRLPAALDHLLEKGWQIRMAEQTLRVSTLDTVTIRSGIDWFELHNELTLSLEDGSHERISLPRILEAVRQGQRMIQVTDGSQIWLSDQWLRRQQALMSLGKVRGGALRFERNQIALLDALLADRAAIVADETFERLRREIRDYQGVTPLPAHQDFQGSLRPYQQAGLGWMAFLRRFGFGGVLADDMGLGKTIQVLAMLQQRHHEHRAQQPQDAPHRVTSLIVAPRSLIFNWLDEAGRFTPELKVLAYTGQGRESLRELFNEHDLVVTSYGLMRRDVASLEEHAFDYLVLDEAQAIKNPKSQAARAVRMLQAPHRLALTGTPVENHLGDLWSIFEFLNPGMLGTATRFARMIKVAGADPDLHDSGQLQPVARMLRPFILRRTKKQVLTDLPAKTEQTIVCDMEPQQQQVYDDLKHYYRAHLIRQNEQPAGDTPSPSPRANSFQVLEALLRLRQAACHPRLIDPGYPHEASTKLATLFEMLEEVMEEGGKALIFSQFTSLLALVRETLDQRGLRYCYLDGQTRDRRAPVEQFQNDAPIPLFLISLKAGGFGLNLTAAEYVFILDPWWNPAVEAQAIDRTHRIGQEKPVFAYRLVCRDSVEQRILDLQARKRQLADAIISEDENLLRDLSRDDLEMLLS